jgi:uncharacterized protein (DUF1697 family)
MTKFAAFLRGVNLGKRTVKSAELKAAFEAMGFAGAKTLLASGNVAFETDGDKGLAARIEKGLAEKFGFEIGVVLRSQAELEAMIAADPFASVPKDADAKLYVAMLAEPVGGKAELPWGVPGEFDVLRITDFDIFAVAWKMDNGRYGEGLDAIGRSFGKKALITTRNWNTILKAAAA